MPKNPDLGALEAARSGNERFVLTDSVLYLHTPDGLGRSKLATNVKKLLGVPTTARNWRTICEVIELTKQDG